MPAGDPPYCTCNSRKFCMLHNPTTAFRYGPQQPSRDELKALIREVLEEMGVETKAERLDKVLADRIKDLQLQGRR